MQVINDSPAPDASWFIALWLAIHGGDPAPDWIGVLRGGVTVLEQAERLDPNALGTLRADVVGVMHKALEQYR